MNIKNCSNCGKIYQYDGFNTCQECRREKEEDFKKVKEYIYENPGAGIAQVSQATEVDSKDIIEFLRQGRLEIEGGGNLILECERCGTSIKTGRFCKKCSLEIENELKGSISSSQKDKEKPRGDGKQKFRIADRYRKD